MKTAGRFLALLVIWWLVQTLGLAHGSLSNWRDFQFALVYTLFFGSMYAIPSIAYLVATESLSSNFSFPRNAVVFFMLVLCGFALLLAIDVYSKGLLILTHGEYRRSYFLHRLIPASVVAGTLLFWQIAKSMSKRNLVERSLGMGYALAAPATKSVRQVARMK